MFDVPVICCDFQSSESDLDEEEDGSKDGIGETILLMWKAHEVKLISDPAITAWALAISPNIRRDVASRLTGNHRDAIERFITKLFSHDVDCDIATKMTCFGMNLNTGGTELECSAMLVASTPQMQLQVGLLAGMQSIHCHIQKSWVLLHADLHQTT